MDSAEDFCDQMEQVLQPGAKRNSAVGVMVFSSLEGNMSQANLDCTDLGVLKCLEVPGARRTSSRSCGPMWWGEFCRFWPGLEVQTNADMLYGNGENVGTGDFPRLSYAEAGSIVCNTIDSINKDVRPRICTWRPTLALESEHCRRLPPMFTLLTC